MNKKRELQKLKTVVKRIVKEYSPEKIILFGSYAWGKPTYDSDFDLMIVKKTQKPWLQRHMALRNIIDGEIPVDLLIRTPSELKKRLDLGDFFYRDIINKGKVLYEKK